MSARPMQNYFLKGLVSSNSLAAFHLKKTPDIASISIGEATRLYALQDFWPALGDFMSGLSHQQRRGRRVSRGCPDVGFEAIRIWFRFRIQLRSVHDSHVLLPAQTVQVLPPSQEHPHGLCDTVLIHGLGGAGESDESVQGSGKSIKSLVPLVNSNLGQLLKSGCYSSQFRTNNKTTRFSVTSRNSPSREGGPRTGVEWKKKMWICTYCGDSSDLR